MCIRDSNSSNDTSVRVLCWNIHDVSLIALILIWLVNSEKIFRIQYINNLLTTKWNKSAINMTRRVKWMLNSQYEKVCFSVLWIFHLEKIAYTRTKKWSEEAQLHSLNFLTPLFRTVIFYLYENYFKILEAQVLSSAVNSYSSSRWGIIVRRWAQKFWIFSPRSPRRELWLCKNPRRVTLFWLVYQIVLVLETNLTKHTV